jgi:uncharacterized protein YeaO (DUF488 family)
MKLRLKRIYEPHADDDGLRVLVDRLWPRGLKKEAAGVDLWAKDVAPSTELRRWFHAEPGADRWAEFRRRYQAELSANVDDVDALLARIGKGTATLLYAAADTEHNHAIVLKEILNHLSKSG